jgi:hypothetical protein
MKKFLAFLMMAALIMTAFYSCKDDDDDDDNDVEASLIKNINFSADWNRAVSGYEFFYNANGLVTNFNRTYAGEPDGAFVYDYTTAGKLKITKDGDEYNTYDINSGNLIIKEPWSDTEWSAYEYDANGYCIKVIEHWDGVDHLKYEMVITNGNIVKMTTYDDDGVTAKRIKEFTYTTGDNVNNIHQANVTDSDWKPVGGYYGKASKKLLDYFEYWDPRENPIEKRRSTLTYEFDAKNRPSKVTKTLYDMSTEVWEYSYYENE